MIGPVHPYQTFLTAPFHPARFPLRFPGIFLHTLLTTLQTMWFFFLAFLQWVRAGVVDQSRGYVQGWGLHMCKSRNRFRGGLLIGLPLFGKHKTVDPNPCSAIIQVLSTKQSQPLQFIQPLRTLIFQFPKLH